jgi:hypothetical protein
MALATSEGTDVGGSRSFRDAAFSLKLLALIDFVVSGLGDFIAGTGKVANASDRCCNDSSLMNGIGDGMTIDSAEGWVFAFEGGAHILFRNTHRDRKFVCPLKLKKVLILCRKVNY